MCLLVCISFAPFLNAQIWNMRYQLGRRILAITLQKRRKTLSKIIQKCKTVGKNQGFPEEEPMPTTVSHTADVQRVVAVL